MWYGNSKVAKVYQNLPRMHLTLSLLVSHFDTVCRFDVLEGCLVVLSRSDSADHPINFNALKRRQNYRCYVVQMRSVWRNRVLLTDHCALSGLGEILLLVCVNSTFKIRKCDWRMYEQNYLVQLYPVLIHRCITLFVILTSPTYSRVRPVSKLKITNLSRTIPNQYVT